MRSYSKVRKGNSARKRIERPPQEASLSLGNRIKLRAKGSPGTVITLALIGLTALGMLLVWASPYELAEVFSTLLS